MKKLITTLVLGVLFFSISIAHVGAEQPRISTKCMEQFKSNYFLFTDKLFEDIFQSFPEIHSQINVNKVKFFTLDDLFKAQLLTGKNDEQLNSLIKFFEGGSKGDRRMYFLNGDPNNAYILFRDTTEQNVMIKIKRNEQEWVEVEKRAVKGKEIELERPRCLDEYFIQRWFYEIFGGLI